MYADDLLLLSPTLTGLQSMFHVCDSYAKDHNLVFNVKKTCCAVIGKHRSVIRRLVLAEQAVPWTDRLRYLGVSFTCSNTLDVDVSPVRRNFYAACNSISARSRDTSEPVRVQLVKSYCLPLLVYCIGALRLKLLQVEFGTMTSITCMTCIGGIFCNHCVVNVLSSQILLRWWIWNFTVVET